MSRLIEVLGEICSILESHGHPDFARRLKEQQHILASAVSPSEEIDTVRKRLHSSVPGMGGLADLWLEAPTHEESVRLQEKLESLADELYELTR
jgi:hypothetical protein